MAEPITLTEMAGALAMILCGDRGIKVLWDKYQRRSGKYNGTKRAVEEFRAELVPHMRAQAQASEDIAIGIKQLNVVLSVLNTSIEVLKDRTSR